MAPVDTRRCWLSIRGSVSRPDVRDGLIAVKQGKTGKELWIPVHRDLAKVLQEIPKRAVTILTNSRGKPWTADGFHVTWRDELMRDEIKELRERRLVFHGLRKSAGVTLPWKECSAMDERVRFVARLLEGEAMSEVCRSFGISRKTGYKIFNRYREHGLEALSDRSRRPWRYANQLPAQVETLIVRIKREKPHWGARKVRELLLKRLAGDVRIPARSTVHAVLDRHGLVKRAKTRRNKAMGTTLADVSLPNALWCADFKGEFRLGNRDYCYPLTVTDQASRFILMCEALQS